MEVSLRPRPAPYRLSVAAFSALAALACGDNEATRSDGDGADPVQQPQASLAFEPASTLLLQPGEEATLSVVSSPPASRTVAFGLLAGNPSELRDASLGATEAVTGADGRATVTLRASSVAATFLVRAALDEQTEARRAVSVSSLGFASLQLDIDYEGNRQLPQWTASARVGTTCSELENPLSDGPLVSNGKSPLQLGAIPAGPDITITVRAGKLAAGCLMITRLDPEEERRIRVLVTDLPLRIDTGSLDLSFGIASASPAFTVELAEAVKLSVDGFSQGKSDDAAVLLDSWAAQLTTDNAAVFSNSRGVHDFDQIVLDLWSDPLQLRRKVKTLLDEAALRVMGPQTFRGRLDFGARRALFSLVSAAGVSASTSGFFPTSSWSRTMDPGDVLVLGGTLQYLPSRWLSAVAEDIALINSSLPPAEELANLANCVAISESLTSRVGGPLYSNCDQACARIACQNAVDATWNRVAGASATLSTLALAISGKARHDSDAVITGFSGTWLGTTTPGQAALGGSAQGSAPVN